MLVAVHVLVRAGQQLRSSPSQLGMMRPAGCVLKPEVDRGEWSQSAIWGVSGDYRNDFQMGVLVKLHVVVAVPQWLCWWGAFVRSLGIRAGSCRERLPGSSLSCPCFCLTVCFETSRVEKYNHGYVYVYMERDLSLSRAVC